VLPIKTPNNPKVALTGNQGQFRTAGGSYIPHIDPTQIAINYLQPGQDGVPVSTGDDPQDIYETDFAPTNQRNIFRQAPQKRLDLSVRKTFRPSERFGVEYQFNVFNVTNTTSLDVPQDQGQIRQNSACSSSATSEGNNCEPGKYYYVNYGQIVTSPSPVDQASAKANLDQIPYTEGSGKGTTIPTLIPVGTRTCVSVYAVPGGCPNNAANFGSVTGTIGGARALTMGLHNTTATHNGVPSGTPLCVHPANSSRSAVTVSRQIKPLGCGILALLFGKVGNTSASRSLLLLCLSFCHSRRESAVLLLFPLRLAHPPQPGEACKNEFGLCQGLCQKT
jgi:hypothetical protein